MSSIVTFYSYKGGVGRSMSLANIAFELAKRNKRVLMVDWDLEAPGLEKYFSYFKIESQGEGLMQLLVSYRDSTTEPDYKKYISTIQTNTSQPVFLLQSGRDTDSVSYSRLLQGFDWEHFFENNNGGIHLENLRNKWLKDFDIVLIDSRTGLSDASGICTIMMPDILIPMFTANYQSLFGIRDTVKNIQSARQKLAFERMALTILPIPARFGTRVEFKESQEWLDRIADILKDCFSDWLPKWIEPRYILEQVKIPQIDFFSFGEKLAVVEHGTNDPEGMGFIYSRIASLLSTDFTDLKSFVGEEYYNSKKNEFEQSDNKSKQQEFTYDLYISYPRAAYQWVRELLIPALTEYLSDKLGRNPQLFFEFNETNIGESLQTNVEFALQRSRTLLYIFSTYDFNESVLNTELNHFLKREKDVGLPLIFPLLYSGNLPEKLPEIAANREIADFSMFNYDETVKSTKLRVMFGQEIDKLSEAIGNTINVKKKSNKKNSSKKNDDPKSESLSDLLQLAKEYEQVRKRMPAGNSRTKVMEQIITEMKTISTDPNSFLPTLTQSESPGERLAAIAKLQKFPSAEYVDWLAEHVGDAEKPFVGYQSSVALYLAARTFGDKQKQVMEDALKKAKKNLYSFEYQDPNQVSVLDAAETELKLKK